MSQLKLLTLPSLDFLTITPLPPPTVHIYVCTHNPPGSFDAEKLDLSSRECVNTLRPPPRPGWLACRGVGGVCMSAHTNSLVKRRPGERRPRTNCSGRFETALKKVYEGKLLGNRWRRGFPDGRWDPKFGLASEEVENLPLGSSELESECSCWEINVG